MIENRTETKRKCPVCGHEKIMVWNAKDKVLGECDKCEHTNDLSSFEEKR